MNNDQSRRVPLGCLLGILPVLASAAASQDVRAPLMPSLTSIRGTWSVACEFKTPRIEASELLAVSREIDADAPFMDKELVGFALRASKSYRNQAGKGGRRPAQRSEVMRYVVRSETEFYLSQEMAGGYRQGGHRGGQTQELWSDSFRARRVDMSPSKETATTFQVGEAGGRFEVCPIFAEWRQHAMVVSYCLERGDVDGSTYTVSNQRFWDSPVQVPVFEHVHNMTMHHKRDGQGDLYTTTLFDAKGRVCREWKSTWVEGKPVRLTRRRLLAFSNLLEGLRDFRVVSHSAETRVPTFAELTALPFSRSKALDLRGKHASTFDPRDGVPAQPKSDEDVVAERIAELKRERAEGTRSKFIENLDRWERAKSDEGESATEPELVLRTVTPDAVGGSRRDRGRVLSAIPVLDPVDPKGAGPFVVIAVSGLLCGLLLVAFRRRRLAAVAALLTVPLMLLTSCERAGVNPDQVILSGGLEISPSSLEAATSAEGGRQRRHVLFWLTSTIGQPIRLVRTASSCPCLQLRPQKSEVPPFGSVRLEGFYDPESLSPVIVHVAWESDRGRGVVQAAVRPAS